MKKALKEGLPQLDELDLALVRAVEENARIGYRELASKLGTSPQTANRRLARLIDERVVKFIALPDYGLLGYKVPMIFAINAPPGKLDKLVRQLASVDSINSYYITAGSYDIMAAALYRSLDEYLSLFPKEMADIPENTRIEAILSVMQVKSNFSYLTNNSNIVVAKKGFVPTALDLSVMKELMESPTASATEIARCIGANRLSVGSSLNRLFSSSAIRIVCVTNPSAFGNNVEGMTLVRVHPSKLETVTSRLQAIPSVTHLSHILGEFNCMLWTCFNNSGQMRQFLADNLGNMPGVEHYESAIILGKPKAIF